MTNEEAQSYRTWATNKGTKEGFGVITSVITPATPKPGDMPRLHTSVRKAARGLSWSVTFETPMHKPRAEADEAFLAACKAVDLKISAQAKEKHHK